MYAIHTKIVRRAMVAVEKSTLFLASSALTLWASDCLVPAPTSGESVLGVPIGKPSSVNTAKTSMVIVLSRLLNSAMR